MKKLVGVILMIGLIGSLLAGCSSAKPSSSSSSPASSSSSSSGGSSADKKTYFINPKSVGPAIATAAQKGAEQAGVDLGVEVIFNAPTEANSSKQINMIQDMLNRNLAGLAIAPNDANAVVPIIKKARESNLPVITWDSDASESQRQYYVAAASDVDLATQMAEEMAKQMGGKGEVAFMVAGLGAQNQIDKFKTAEKYFQDNFPEIKVVTMVSSDDDSQKAFANAQNLIQTYPNLGGIIGFAGAEAPAAAEVIEQAVSSGKLKAGQIKLTGLVIPSLISKYLKSGTVEKAFLWDPSKIGYTTVYVLDQLAQGKTITDGLEIPNVGAIKLEGNNIYVGSLAFTKDNVDEFEF